MVDDNINIAKKPRLDVRCRMSRREIGCADTGGLCGVTLIVWNADVNVAAVNNRINNVHIILQR